MNPTEAKQEAARQIAVQQAASDGKMVEICNRNMENWQPYLKTSDWDWVRHDYRIAADSDKPQWPDNAPLWAQWMAYNEVGDRYAYETEPCLAYACFYVKQGPGRQERLENQPEFTGDWRSSLIQRPQESRCETLDELRKQKPEPKQARECPHCKGDLSRYEDPLAVTMMAQLTRERDEARRESENLVRSANELRADRDEARRELAIRTEDKERFRLLHEQLGNVYHDMIQEKDKFKSRTDVWQKKSALLQQQVNAFENERDKARISRLSFLAARATQERQQLAEETRRSFNTTENLKGQLSDAQAEVKATKDALSQACDEGLKAQDEVKRLDEAFIAMLNQRDEAEASERSSQATVERLRVALELCITEVELHAMMDRAYRQRSVEAAKTAAESALASITAPTASVPTSTGMADISKLVGSQPPLHVEQPASVPTGLVEACRDALKTTAFHVSLVHCPWMTEIIGALTLCQRHLSGEKPEQPDLEAISKGEK